MTCLRNGHIQSFYDEVMQISSWKSPTDRPPLKPGNMAVQLAADANNYRSAAARVCADTKIASIGPSNIESNNNMYVDWVPSRGFPVPPKTTAQYHHLRRHLQLHPLGSKEGSSRGNFDLIISSLVLLQCTLRK